MIEKLRAREVLDSRGFPTVEVDLELKGGSLGRAIVPSGASTGEYEALELRDGDSKRFLGKGVQKAVSNVNEKIAPSLIGRDFARLTLLDDLLRELDGTENKSNLGANALLGVSMAYVRARSALESKSTSAYIAETMGTGGITLPAPMMNIMNGGAHANNALDIQEFMIIPAGFTRFSEALRAGCEVFHHLKRILNKNGQSTAVGDEGGFAPNFDGDHPHEQALTSIMDAISDAGYEAGKQIYLALDVASSELEKVRPTDENEPTIYEIEGKRVSSQDLIDLYSSWIDTYPILSIEDGLSENDWAGWAKLTEKLGSKVQLVGDDLFVTNAKFLQKGIEQKVANSILIKLNQIGTVTETLETIQLAKQSRYTSVTSHRSGETEDTFIADLAVGSDSGQIKTGSASRTDRIAKYNQLLRIEESLGKDAQYAGRSAFKSLS